MTDLDFLADDGLVDALLMEIQSLLRRLVEHGEEGAIDLRGLPLSPACIAALERQLGKGEVDVTLGIAGYTKIRETSFPGVWWTKHSDMQGDTVALLIEIATVPQILRADIEDIERGLERLPLSTNIAIHARKGVNP